MWALMHKGSFDKISNFFKKGHYPRGGLISPMPKLWGMPFSGVTVILHPRFSGIMVASFNIHPIGNLPRAQFKTTRAQLRAYVLPDGVSIINEGHIVKGQLIWNVAPWWKNSGATPTRNASVISNLAFSEKLLTEAEFPPPIPDVTEGAEMTISFSPNGGRHAASSVAINAATMGRISSGKLHFYIFSRISYDDVFSGHWQSETCFQMHLPNRDWNKVEPQSEPGGSQCYFTKHNCADKECGD
jgi:hypothetical protein